MTVDYWAVQQWSAVKLKLTWLQLNFVCCKVQNPLWVWVHDARFFQLFDSTQDFLILVQNIFLLVCFCNWDKAKWTANWNISKKNPLEVFQTTTVLSVLVAKLRVSCMNSDIENLLTPTDRRIFEWERTQYVQVLQWGAAGGQLL